MKQVLLIYFLKKDLVENHMNINIKINLVNYQLLLKM